MAPLSDHDCEIIARHPLGSLLGRLDKFLRDAEQSYASISSPQEDTQDDSDTDDSEADDAKQGRRVAILRLLSALVDTEAALHLRLSGGSGSNIVSKLAILIQLVHNGHFNYSSYRPLTRLVIHNASDSEIWSAVFDLIPSVLATHDDTPMAHSSASQERTRSASQERTRKAVERKVFQEIRFCTYRHVQGFFEKYFEGKEWTRRALDIYKATKQCEVVPLPDPPVQAEVFDWWFKFQDDFLPEEQGRYYTTMRPTDLVGAEAQRHIHLFLKRMDRQTPNATHDWRDVQVIGGLRASSKDKNASLLQLGQHVRDVFSWQPTRRYVPAFSICGREMEVWVFDRAGCYSPGAFDIDAKPERFIQVIAGYMMMDEEELGLDMFTERDGKDHLVHVEQDLSPGSATLRLRSQFFTRQRAIVGRGTSCFLTKPPDSEHWSCVAKFSWTSDKRKPEADLLRLATQRGVEGVARLIGHRRITSIQEMRSGLTFPEPYSFRGHPGIAPASSQSSSRSRTSSSLSQSSSGRHHDLSLADKQPKRRKLDDGGEKSAEQPGYNGQRRGKGQNDGALDLDAAQGASLRANNNTPYDTRVFRCLVISPAGRALYKYGRLSELLEALRDAIKAHRSLYLKGNILHRDISENNIIITDAKEVGVVGMLIDLDLAKERDSARSAAPGRTGTTEFMAIEVLLEKPHTYRHDLESFLYVLIWQCARCAWGKVWPISKWYSGSYRDMAHAKRADMQVDGFEDVLKVFVPRFNAVKPLCRELRGILFPYQDGLFMGTPEDPEVLYGPILEAFGKAIDDMKATE